MPTNPNSRPSCVFSLDADADFAGTADGATIAAWGGLAKSGTPTLKRNYRAGKNAVRLDGASGFDGASAALDTAQGLVSAIGGGITFQFVVALDVVDSGTIQSVFGKSGSPSDRWNFVKDHPTPSRFAAVQVPVVTTNPWTSNAQLYLIQYTYTKTGVDGGTSNDVGTETIRMAGQPAAIVTGQIMAPLNTTGLWRVASMGGAYRMTGYMSQIRVDNRVLTEAELANDALYWQNYYKDGRVQLFACGDSRTFGVDDDAPYAGNLASVSYPAQLLPLLPPGSELYNYGAPGATTAQVVSGASNHFSVLSASVRNALMPTVIAWWAGVNDFNSLGTNPAPTNAQLTANAQAAGTALGNAMLSYSADPIPYRQLWADEYDSTAAGWQMWRPAFGAAVSAAAPDVPQSRLKVGMSANAKIGVAGSAAADLALGAGRKYFSGTGGLHLRGRNPDLSVGGGYGVLASEVFLPGIAALRVPTAAPVPITGIAPTATRNPDGTYTLGGSVSPPEASQTLAFGSPSQGSLTGNVYTPPATPNALTARITVTAQGGTTYLFLPTPPARVDSVSVVAPFGLAAPIFAADGGTSVQLAANVAGGYGGAGSGVTWAADGGATFTGGNTLNLPASGASVQIINVVATSTLDTSKSGSARVIVPATNGAKKASDVNAEILLKRFS